MLKERPSPFRVSMNKGLPLFSKPLFSIHRLYMAILTWDWLMSLRDAGTQPLPLIKRLCNSTIVIRGVITVLRAFTGDLEILTKSLNIYNQQSPSTLMSRKQPALKKILPLSILILVSKP